MAISLKPSEEVQVSALSAAVVFGIFQLHAPNMADVKAAPPGNGNAHNAVKSAAWTSAVVVSGLSLLAKSPTIFIVGGAMIVAESWQYFHANCTDPQTGAVDMVATAGM